MSISEIQLVANRRNALRSTGPVSAEGKLRSAANAIKHGKGLITVELMFEGKEDYALSVSNDGSVLPEGRSQPSSPPTGRRG